MWTKKLTKLAATCLTIVAASVLAAAMVHRAVTAGATLGVPPHSGLLCAEPLKRFGEVDLGAVSHVFEVRNALPDAVDVKRIGKSCSCMTVGIDKRRLAPGESARLSVSFNVTAHSTREAATFYYECAVHAETRDGTHHALLLGLEGTGMASAYSRLGIVVLDAPEDVGGSFAGGLDVFLNRERGAAIHGIECLGPLRFNADVASSETLDGDPFERVKLSLTGRLEPGPLPQAGGVRVRTTRGEFTVPVVLRLAKCDDLTFSPRKFAFGVVEAGTTVTQVIRFEPRDGSRLRLVSVECPDDRVQLNAEGGDPADPKPTLRCGLDTTGAVGNIASSVTVIFGNGERHQSYVVPVSAFVKPASQ